MESLQVKRLISEAICDIPFEAGADPNSCKVDLNMSPIEGKDDVFKVEYTLKLKKCSPETMAVVRSDLENDFVADGNFKHALIRKGKVARCHALTKLQNISGAKLMPTKIDVIPEKVQNDDDKNGNDDGENG